MNNHSKDIKTNDNLSRSINKILLSKNGLIKKKINNYSYYLNDAIGKGYSSTVYQGKN